MKYTHILITGIALILTGCSEAQQNDDFSLRHGIAPQALSARISFRVLEENDGVKRVGIVVTNPHEVPIQSVRSWVKFDPSSVRISSLLTPDERFVLFAPGEREIDEQLGYIKLGGAVKNPVSDGEIMFASFVVRKTGSMRTQDNLGLTFYDWKAEGDGHTAVLSLLDSDIQNIIQAPSSFAL